MTTCGPAILVVDDEVDNCRNLADIFGDLGYRVDTAHNGFDALKLVQGNTYDIALLDLKMPGMDGLTLYREIKKLSAGTVAIIISAYVVNSTRNEALAAGALQVLSKPVDFPRLMELMDQTLKQPMVLVVDDDGELCASLWDLLRDQGYRVCVAHNENEAANRLITRKYDVVLIDMKLPQGDGQGVFQKVRQSDLWTRTIAITGCEPETGRLVQQVLEAGADAVFYKPFDIPALLKTLERLSAQRDDPSRG